MGLGGAPNSGPADLLRQLIHQLLDAAEQRLFRARDVGEAQLERTVETIFLGLSLNELEHAFRIDLMLLLEQDVAVAGAGIDLADSQQSGAKLKISPAAQGVREGR